MKLLEAQPSSISISLACIFHLTTILSRSPPPFGSLQRELSLRDPFSFFGFTSRCFSQKASEAHPCRQVANWARLPRSLGRLAGGPLMLGRSTLHPPPSPPNLNRPGPSCKHCQCSTTSSIFQYLFTLTFQFHST